MFCLKAFPKVKGRETGEFTPLGATNCQWGQEGQRQRGPPPEVRPLRGDRTQVGRGRQGAWQAKRRGPRGPAWPALSLASASDVG